MASHSKSVTDLIGAARNMPGVDSAALYSDTAAQVCQRSLDNLFHAVAPVMAYEQQVVLDLGCGTGESTSSLICKLPCVQEMKAVDRSLEFIEFAREVNENKTITYQCMDVEEEWPSSWQHKYTMVFSNYVFHWIKDHRQLLAKINQSMRMEADLMVQFFHSATMSKETMQAAMKAAHDCNIQKEMLMAVTAIKKQTPVWKDITEYRKLISSLGFRVEVCKVEERQYICQSKFERAGMTVTVSPFMNHVPAEKKLLFATKYVSYLQDPYTIHHKAVVVHAVKINDC